MHPSKYNRKSVSLATYALRCSIVATMIVAAATILHLSHYTPKQIFLSCDRPCHHLDWPMICRVKLTLEVYQSLSKSCGNCPANETECFANHCVSADGERRGLLTANRQMPGPSIQVCENDILVVDVVNRLPGRAAAMHWRGQLQSETPCMDGTPLITQCPIPSYTTFQYKFRAARPGTHMWHAHAGADTSDGVFGSLIVRQADIRDPQRNLYDIDDPNHVILINEWQHSFMMHASTSSGLSKALLVNGKGRRPGGRKVPFTSFTVTPGRRHRFRVAHAGGAGSCPITLSVENHSLLVIALDGYQIDPRLATSITLVKGERVDFVLKTNQEISSYWLNVETTRECATPSLAGAAILRYKGSPEVEPAAILENSIDTEAGYGKEEKIALKTILNEDCGSNGNVCITEIDSMQKMPGSLTARKTDVTIYLPINYSIQTTDFIGGLDDLVYHLHGYSFHVVGVTKFGRSVTVKEVKELDNHGALFNRNLDRAPLKDTIAVPKFGLVALRFKADNPGYWILRDEHSPQWTRGLDVILQVGDPSEMIPAPQDFPKCGSFIGPDYFLI